MILFRSRSYSAPDLLRRAWHVARILLKWKGRAPFGVALSLSFGFAILGVAMALAAARGPAAPPPRAAVPQYNVLFSRDDKLCSTLRDFYNRHLRDRDSETTGYIEDQFGRELQGTDIQFLRESENWRPPRDLLWTQVFSAIDIYDDGTSHAVIVVDIRPGARIDRNGVLVYSVAGSGAIADICYLEFVFTQPVPKF